jgi:hypothetical protein
MNAIESGMVSTFTQSGPLRVFVSSRMQELRDARAVVEKALSDIYVEAFVYEKDAGARDASVVVTSLSEVERSDVVVALFSQSYGHVTGTEFLHARKLKKPCLVYLEGKNLQRDDKLDEFLRKEVYDLQRGITYAYFEDVVELGEKVGRDIMRLLVEVHRRGGRGLPIGVLPPVARLAWDVADWYQVQPHGYKLAEEPSFVNEKTMDLKIRVDLNMPGLGQVRQELKVRCAHGRVERSDIESFCRDFEASGAEKGQVISDLEITPAARNLVAKSQRLSAQTLDELLDQTLRFDDYLDFLEGKIKTERVDSEYLTLGCTWQEAGRNGSESLAVSQYSSADGGVDRYLELWLRDSRKEHVSILGEFGTGKTWTVLHIAWEALEEYRRAKNNHLPRPRLPLLVSLRDFAKTVSLESLISDFFFARHNVGIPSYDAFRQLNRMGKFLLLFDGFDEMAARVDRQKMINNFWEFARVLVPGAKAILTCRTEHFLDAREGRLLLSSEIQASTANLSGEAPQFEVVNLEKFEQSQIETVLSRKASLETVRRIMDNPDLMDLAGRPLMVDLILKALPEVEAGAPVDLSRVYLYAVRRKMVTDIETKGAFVSLADKFLFLCELSWEMLSTDRMSLNYRDFPEFVRRIFGVLVQEEKELDHWCRDLMAHTVLVPNAEGDYSLAHRSFLEFFVAYRFVAELGVLASDFTDVARELDVAYVDENAAPERYTWSAYFRRELGEAGCVRKKAPLKCFSMESFDETTVGIDFGNLTDSTHVSGNNAVRVFSTDDFVEATPRKGVIVLEKLTRNTCALAAGMVSDDPEDLDKLCQMAWQRSGSVAWNALTLLPYLKNRRPEVLAAMLVNQSDRRSLRSGVAWVLGELGVNSDQVLESLIRTAQLFALGRGGSCAAWWESAFALEKLGHFGPRKGRQGDEAVRFLINNLPLGCNLEQSKLNLERALTATEAQEATVDPCDIVTIVEHEAELGTSTFFETVLSLVDFSADAVGRRCYYVVWLCGHLRIQESLNGILKATGHRQGSVRNCACEALGKIGITNHNVTAALERALSDGYYRTRFHSVWALAEICSVASLPKLSAAIRVEEVRDVRQEMVRVRDFLQAQSLGH